MQTLKIDLVRDMPDRSRIVAELEIRGNENPRGLSPGFSLCGSLYEAHGTWSGAARERNDKDIDGGGQIREDIARAFPKSSKLGAGLARFASLHLSDLDGVPMHAIANGLYFYRYARGIPQQYGFDNKYGEAERAGFKDPRDYARKVVCDLLRVENLAELDSVPYLTPKQFDDAFSRFIDAQRARWREEAESVTAWLVNLIEAKAREILRTENANDPSGEWSAYDLGKAMRTSTETAESVLKLICPDGGRFVGGTSGSLYWLPPEPAEQ